MTKEGASLKPVQYGMDWGYGMFSGGSVYGNLSTNIILILWEFIMKRPVVLLPSQFVVRKYG
ncbi:hypothetical protein [Bacteroides uniformis]|uniref:hypothetical protein n=1 Tax=Bacteroides uniformis TaxID=820 RepID=UPI001FAFF44D|nr:hypothetical protein [Bacteroides uniformis]